KSTVPEAGGWSGPFLGETMTTRLSRRCFAALLTSIVLSVCTPSTSSASPPPEPAPPSERDSGMAPLLLPASGGVPGRYIVSFGAAAGDDEIEDAMARVVE